MVKLHIEIVNMSHSLTHDIFFILSSNWQTILNAPSRSRATFFETTHQNFVLLPLNQARGLLRRALIQRPDGQPRVEHLQRKDSSKISINMYENW